MTIHFLRLMGPPTLIRNDDAGQTVPVPLSPAALTLLSLISLNGDGTRPSRGAVAEALWPDAAPEKSASRLSSALCRLQKSLGPEARHVLDSSQGRIGLVLGPEFDVDVLAVSRCIRTLRRTGVADWRMDDVARLEAAINHRDGGFLEGLEGDWLLDARQRCSEIYEEGLEALIQYHRHRGHVERSIAAARKLARQDPYREDAHAVLVELYGHKGQRGRAVEQYAACRETLRNDLGIDPGPGLASSLKAALGQKDSAVTMADLVVILQRLDRTVAHLARQIDEIHGMLGHRTLPPRDPTTTQSRRSSG